MKSLIAPFLFFVCVCACTKDRAPLPTIPAPTYDTVFPGDYLPLYPGSWWEYIGSNGQIFIERVTNKYELDSFQFDSIGKKFYSVPRYVPIYVTGKPRPFYKYSTPWTFSNGEKVLLPWLTEIEGDIWKSSVASSGNWYLKVAKKDSSVTVNGKVYERVIVIYNSTIDSLQNPRVIGFFSRNIGFVKSITINYTTLPPDTYITRQLINYHINH